ncbi:phosphate ABC transporter permease subunit PstC [bacterium]|nr:phosphate ABC transporter permease subunit PstC [bacterium]
MTDIDFTRTARREMLIGESASRLHRIGGFLGHSFLLLLTSLSAFAVLFIFLFIIRDALPFFRLQGFHEFFTSARWYPSSAQPEFGALAIFVGTALVTSGAVLLATPLGVAAAVCLSDVLPFSARQIVKPMIEILAAIPSVAYGFFALIVFAPLLQERGGLILAICVWVIGAPLGALGTAVASDLGTTWLSGSSRKIARIALALLLGGLTFAALYWLGVRMSQLHISSGTNALNVSLILGIMALPTVVSVSEDALYAVGRELREGSYALGATRAETLIKVVIPAASSGILAAVLLGVMRAVGETMVVWMASGNAAQIPEPWFNLLEPVRTLTATIAGDMGEADQVTGSSRYHVLFAMGLCLLSFSFLCNLASEWAIRRFKRARATG